MNVGYVAAGSWSDANQDNQAFQDVDNLRRSVEQLAASSGNDLQFVFMNDASPTQTVLEGYGPENLEKLRKTAAKYDPGKVFQELQNGGNLLRNLK